MCGGLGETHVSPCICTAEPETVETIEAAVGVDISCESDVNRHGRLHYFCCALIDKHTRLDTCLEMQDNDTATCEMTHHGDVCGASVANGTANRVVRTTLDGKTLLLCSGHYNRKRAGKTGDDLTRPVQSKTHKHPADATCEIDHHGDVCGASVANERTTQIIRTTLDGKTLLLCSGHYNRKLRGKTGDDLTRPSGVWRPKKGSTSSEPNSLEVVLTAAEVLAAAPSSSQVLAAGVHRDFLMGGEHPVALAWFQQMAADDRFDVTKPAADRLAKRTLDGYQQRSAAFVKWCDAHDVNPLDVNAKLLEQLAFAYLKGKQSTLTTDGLKSIRLAIRWWAYDNSLGDAISERITTMKGRGAGKGKARPLNAKDLRAILAALNAREVWKPTKNVQQEWCDLHHLRMKAAILTTIDSSLRLTSELPQLRRDMVVEIKDSSIAMKLPQSKAKDDAVDITISYRGDEACPATAVHDFLVKATAMGVDLCGQLIPALARQSKRANPNRSDACERLWWKELTKHCGIDPQSTLHGLRATLPTVAVEEGWRLKQIQDLGRWVNETVAAGYAHARIEAPHLEEFGEVAS